jgi:hypothetical protein
MQNPTTKMPTAQSSNDLSNHNFRTIAVHPYNTKGAEGDSSATELQGGLPTNSQVKIRNKTKNAHTTEARTNYPIH